jgi:peroxiredoxin
LYAALAHSQIVFDTLDGKRISLESLANKKIVINYWADWCQPCVDEIKSLNDFYQNFHQKVALFAVNFDQPPLSEQRDAVKIHHIDYPSLAVNPAKMLALGNIRAVPATFIIDARGNVQKVLYGPQTAESLLIALNLKEVNNG